MFTATNLAGYMAKTSKQEPLSKDATMRNLMNTKTFSTAAGLLAAAVLSGCGYNHDENFAGDTAPTSIGRISQAQSAAGAKEDAMLYDMHFHGSELTSLGEGKLDLIAKGTPAGDPVTIYMNMPHDQIADRQLAVTTYLKNAGIAEGKIIVAEGPNPNLTTPTAYNITGVYKPDGTSFNGAAAAESDSGPAGSPSSSAGGH
jgi:hypothetical protein